MSTTLYVYSCLYTDFLVFLSEPYALDVILPKHLLAAWTLAISSFEVAINTLFTKHVITL